MRDLVKSLLQSRSRDHGDTMAVAGAADLLQVPEFRFFSLAYARWFGSEPMESQIEPYFASYMHTQIAPCWVRDLARRVAGADRAGHLDPSEFGVAHAAAIEPAGPYVQVLGEAVVFAPVFALAYMFLHAL